ncbi:SGNH/GDSL hydrolase family protein [Pseudomonas sp. DP-17]|uniref:SGNH/GDSL hydrolase family protein n=1 Tax=Pseudomonas sp. DP-17 TaxID=1580486 RepID=UPI001EFA54AB|nr:SGNH/GDSL hydrolase family protein [Pseudomonas sp. DP-17]MCG8907314.1 SGNH/GDSL hydrolase family protein [Pseudomonas sp. DP-17]
MGRVYSVLKNTTRGINSFLFGDSTVEGGFTYLSWPFFLQTMLPEMAQCQGIQQPFNVTNRGVGGTKVSDMNAIPDVSATTDLFIIKYGINDGTNPLATRLATFRDQLRAKLTQIRQQTYGTVANLAILLVGPNSTYDTQGQRDAYWYEQLRGIYVQAAEEFQCGFFDTDAYLQDSSAGTATGWLDDTVSPGSGRGVHPTDIGNPWIWGAVMDWLLGGQQLYGRRTNNFVNNGGTFAYPLPAKTPQEYRKGITMERARLTDGWPEEGAVVTTMQADGIGEQRLFPFANNRTKVYVRNCYTTGNYWNRWTGARENLVFANSWTAFGAPYSTPGAVLSSNGTVTLTGSIKGGTVTAGTTFATLPAGMRPVLQEEFVVCTSTGTARIIIYPDGSMQGLSALDATRTSLGGITFPAA